MPPKCKCDICDKPVTAQHKKLTCNICQLPHHIECLVYVSSEAFDTIDKLNKDSGYNSWMCRKCNVVCSKFAFKIDDNSKRITALETDVKTLKDDRVVISNNIRINEENIKQIDEKLENKISESKNDVIDEIELRHLKQCNLLIYGLEEGDIESDKNTLNSLIERLNLGTQIEDKIKFNRRLGKKGLNKRPFLVGFHDKSIRDLFYQTSRNLKDDMIKIKPDLTDKQRADNKILFSRIKELNANQPRDIKGNFTWKIIGPPDHFRVTKSRKVTVETKAPEANTSNNYSPETIYSIQHFLDLPPNQNTYR